MKTQIYNEISRNLLDGAGPLQPAMTSELSIQKYIASNQTLRINERLEAYDDILESAVSDMVISRARNIEREIGLR